jgi:hypothetical protein
MRRASPWIASLAAIAIGMLWSEMARSCVRCFIFNEDYVCANGFPDGFDICHVTDFKCIPDGVCNTTGCFLAGTLVETVKGPRALEEVQVGDIVLGVDDNGDYILNEVLETIRSIAYRYYVINETIEVTETHPFFVGQRWVPAGELCVGDLIAGADGRGIAVESIHIADWGVRTFNLTVAGNHTFFADGALVHNKPGDPNDP